MDLNGSMLADRYEIIKKVGNGGMATVYKAKDTLLNRFVAVKILRDEFTTDQEFIKRFEVEAQAAASITHPNIVSVYDVGKQDNLHYIVMELIQGKTLKEIILEENGPLPWKWSVNIAIQIASALETAHKNNIIHRDIKPHNIIITEDGVAKVTDFGIAKAVSNSTITAFGTTIGSVHYFSPEHARGGYTDAKSDLYSLGVVMYEMLTGKLPFDADTPVSVALKHMQEDPEEPIEVNEKVPEAVNDIIMKALRKDTSLRYQSATAMLRDLNMSLKDPDGDFVDNEDTYSDEFATQRISTIYDDDDLDESGNKRGKKKKDNKLVAWIKEHKKLSAVLGLILLFLLSFGGTWVYAQITAAKIDIPNLVGVEIEQAKRQVDEINNKNQKLKLTVEVAGEEYNEKYPAGQIISQDPTEKKNVKENTTIKVVVSKGIEKVTVPKVVGEKEADAVKTLEELGLKFEVEEETNKKVEAGIVFEQDKEAGTEVNKGDTIKIKVSAGAKKVQVPSVIGSEEEEAKSTLSKAGFKVTVVYEEEKGKEDGTVLKQSIDAGKEVNEGSSITITVNKVAEEKTATININVKSITKGYDASDKDYPDSEKKVTVKLTADGNTVYSKSGVDKNTATLSPTITGKGKVKLILEIKDTNGGEWTDNYTIDLDSETTYAFN
ncbi:MAG: Stk1 family PASTA domain-containing Ser/Thr kinase [Clostridia bacterium]|nr:Stk1 family PASTA domain-containing Ser/Thr kinase [Clostridia bacterium]